MVVLVLALPFLIWSLMSDYQNFSAQTKERIQCVFQTLCEGRNQTHIQERGYELVESFREFEVGKCRPVCLLLRTKHLDEKEKQKAKNTNFPENTNIGRVHPGPTEFRESSASFTTTAKCDPKTLKVG
jgi:hypothetical protein